MREAVVQSLLHVYRATEDGVVLNLEDPGRPRSQKPGAESAGHMLIGGCVIAFVKHQTWNRRRCSQMPIGLSFSHELLNTLVYDRTN